MLTYHSTAHIAVIKLCTNDAEIFLHFHAFLAALSGMGTLPTPVLTSLKNPTEHPVVKTTELNSIAEKKCMNNGKNKKIVVHRRLTERRYQQTTELFHSHRANLDEPFGPGLYLLTTEEREKITFARVLLMFCTHSLVRRGYCLWRQKAWTSRFPR